MRKLLTLSIVVFSFVAFSCSTKDSGNSAQSTNTRLDPVKPDGEEPTTSSNTTSRVVAKLPQLEDEHILDYCLRLRASKDPGAINICTSACLAGEVPESRKGEICTVVGKTHTLPPSFIPNDCNEITNKTECKAKCCVGGKLFEGGGEACGAWVTKYGCPAI